MEIVRVLKRRAAHNITGAPTSHSDDLRSREVRYLLSMAVRTVCFLAAVFLAEGWLRWVLLLAAVFLPYVAVVFANAGKGTRRTSHTPYQPPASGELSPGYSSQQKNSRGE